MAGDTVSVYDGVSLSDEFCCLSDFEVVFNEVNTVPSRQAVPQL